jgi:hypothetical protein
MDEKKERRKQYYLDNRERILEKNKKYYYDNIEIRKEYNRNYWEINKDVKAIVLPDYLYKLLKVDVNKKINTFVGFDSNYGFVLVKKGKNLEVICGTNNR